jgi:hypothetical protein
MPAGLGMMGNGLYFSMQMKKYTPFNLTNDKLNFLNHCKMVTD